MSKPKKAKKASSTQPRNDDFVGITSFNLFAKDKKQMVRELVLSSINLTAVGLSNYTDCVQISRCRKLAEGSYQPEKCRVDYAINKRMHTFHLHDIFLSPEFGLHVEISEGAGTFRFDTADSAFGEDLIVTDAKTGRALKPCSFVRSEPIQ